MNKRSLWITVGVLAIAGFTAFHFMSASSTQPSHEGQRGMNGSGLPMPVIADTVQRGDIDVIVNALGTVTANSTITVKPRIDGQLLHVAFREGQMVKAGELLAEIDPRPFQAQLDQANGQLMRDQALLTNAQLDAARYRELLVKDSIASQQVDAQDALVRQYQGVVVADRGAVDNARLQLGFTRITAPASGRLGLRQVDAGNMVHASDTVGLVIITQTQPIAVIFSIPANGLDAVLKQVQGGATLLVEAWDREGKNKLASGKLLSLDNQIDTTTGTVKIKAEFANADNALFPNQFVNTRLRVETRHAATLAPIAAVQRGTLGTFVYVVNEKDLTVNTRAVTLGPNTADVVAIDKGLEPGEKVVVDGADKLREGAKVELSTPESRQAAQKASQNGGAKGGKHGGQNRNSATAPAAGTAATAPAAQSNE